MKPVWLTCCLLALGSWAGTSLWAGYDQVAAATTSSPSATAAALAATQGSQPVQQPDYRRPSKKRTAPSLLHNFLGIDPQTDAFLPPQRTARQQKPKTPSAQPQASGSSNVAQSHVPNSPAVGRVLDPQPLPVDAVSDLLGQLKTDDPLVQIASVLPQLRPSEPTAPADWRVAGAVSLALLLVALLLMLSFWMGWRNRKQDDTLDAFDLRYYSRRFRRRTLTAAIMGVLAVLVPLGSYLLEWWNAPSLSTAYWGIVLSLSTWASVLLAVDYYTAKSYVRAALANMRRNQQELMQQVNELKARLTGEPRGWSRGAEVGSPQSSFAGE